MQFIECLAKVGLASTQPRASPKQSRRQMVSRLSEAAEAIRLLRINSAIETAIELESIAKELEELPEEKVPAALKETADAFLRVLLRVADQLATIRGARMLISGLVSVVLAGAGFSAVAVFGLSLAFWEGKEASLKAIEALKKNN